MELVSNKGNGSITVLWVLVLDFATRMFPGLALRSLINFRCLAFVLKVDVKVVVILVVWAVGNSRAIIKMVVDLAYTNQPGTRYGA